MSAHCERDPRPRPSLITLAGGQDSRSPLMETIRRGGPFTKIVDTLREEAEKMPRSREVLLLLVGSSVRGHYAPEISDIDVLGTFVGKKPNLPYVDLAGLREYTTVVKSTIRRLEEEGVYAVTIPQYASGIWMGISARQKVADERGIRASEIRITELQFRFYTSIDEAIITEGRPRLLEHTLAGGVPLLGGEFLDTMRDYVSLHTSLRNRDALTDQVLEARKILNSAFVTYDANVHLPIEGLFKQALEVSKDVVVILGEEHILKRGIITKDWSFGDLYRHKEELPPTVRETVETLHGLRQNGVGEPHLDEVTGDLYRGTARLLNEFVNEHSGDLTTRLIVERRM